MFCYGRYGGDAMARMQMLQSNQHNDMLARASLLQQQGASLLQQQGANYAALSQLQGESRINAG